MLDTPFGRWSVGTFLFVTSRGDCWAAHKIAKYLGETVDSVIHGKPFIGLRRHSGEFAGKNKVRPLFLLLGFFLSVLGV